MTAIYDNYYEINSDYRIGNPHHHPVNELQQDILVEFTKHLTPVEMMLFRITSTTRINDAFGFHRNGHAIDAACDTLHLMIKLHDGMIDADWPGGIAVASQGLPLHVHTDSRHLTIDPVTKKHYTTCYFLEQRVGARVIYPVKQIAQALYQNYYNAIRRLYGAER